MAMRVRVESRSSGNAISFAFLVAVILAAVMGAMSPRAIRRVAFSAWDCPEDASSFDSSVCHGSDLSAPHGRWHGEILHLDRMNQFFMLRAAVHNKDWRDHGIEKHLEVSVDMQSHRSGHEDWTVVLNERQHTMLLTCPDSRELCDNITVLHQTFINADHWNVSVAFPNARSTPKSPSFMGDVTFQFEFVSPQFTVFELVVKYTFVLVTLQTLGYYARCLQRFDSKRDWKHEHRWVGCLLVGLLGFNDPLFVFTLMGEWPWLFPLLTLGLRLTFIAALLLFWLCSMDCLLQTSEELEMVRFYGPKLLLVGSMWALSGVFLIWHRLHQIADPMVTFSELPGFGTCYLVGTALLVVYCFWLLYLSVRAHSITHTYPMAAVGICPNQLGATFRFDFLVRHMFMLLGLLITGCSIAHSLGGTFPLLSIGVSAPVQHSGWKFLSYLTIMNAYCYALAYAYLPSHTETPYDFLKSPDTPF